MITQRDEEILMALFFCRYLTTNQIAALFFNSSGAAGRRLWQLDGKGYVTRNVIHTTAPTKTDPGKREAVWYLQKEAFEMVAHSLDLDEGPGAYKYVPKPLGPTGARHHVKTNEVYVAGRADLEDSIGEHPHWIWLHEKKAHDAYQSQGVEHKHQPDAHVSFFGHTFIIERQTRESKVKPKDIDDKVREHALWANKRTDHPDRVEVVFACDEERVAEVAREAGKRYEIYVAAGSVEAAANYLYQSALRLAPDGWNAA